MELGDYIIPEVWESMYCIYNCGFFLVWKQGSPEEKNVGTVMEGHLDGHNEVRPSFMDWLRYGRGKGNGFR